MVPATPGTPAMPFQFWSYPTIYEGVNFRSRLEARWACFFDFMELEWHYEPFDLRGWVPDFLIRLPDCKFRSNCHFPDELIVEIKPGSSREELLEMMNPRMPHPDEFNWTALFGIKPEVIDMSAPNCSDRSGGVCNPFDSCRFANSPSHDYFDKDRRRERRHHWIAAGNEVQYLPTWGPRLPRTLR